ncbi:hypothetical protein CVT26_006309 [Gymnopilus dilepis]|uniref:Uncharacterized protein n=1 Tax=Gymnopilus dilepis TaxID=231916 RepID=A0A409Y0P4_9AGAR|nr:hypothetical protein CVT26_006309 [Gymnopilus dilepis]
MDVPQDYVLKDIWESRVASYVWGEASSLRSELDDFAYEVYDLYLGSFWANNVYLEVTSIASPVIIACSDVGEKGEVVASEGFIRLATIFWAFSVNVRIPVHFLRETLLIAWQIESTPSHLFPGYSTIQTSVPVSTLLLVQCYSRFEYGTLDDCGRDTGHEIVQIYTVIKFGASIAETSYVPSPGTPILGCLTAPNLAGVGVTVGWVVSIIGAAIYFLMTVAKFYQSAAEARRCGHTVRFPPLAKAFIPINSVALVAGDVSASFVPGPFVALYEPWMAASLVVAGSRLLLNLRAAAFHEGTITDTTFESVLRGLDQEENSLEPV